VRPPAEHVHWLFATGFLALGLCLLAEAVVGTEVWRRRAWRAYLWPGIAFFLGVFMWPVMTFFTSSTLHMLAHGAWAEVLMGAGAVELALAGALRGLGDDLGERLLALLPVLLQRLRTGMELVELARPEQQALLDELMVIHAEALRPGGRTTTAALTPEQIVQRLRDEVVPEPAVARHFGDSVIDLSSMETVPADVLESGHDAQPEDEPGARVERLRAGDRMRLFVQGRWSRAQLLWRSERGQFFLFAGDSPTRTHSITRRALERRAGEGLIQPLEAKPLLQRAVDHLMRELAAGA